MQNSLCIAMSNFVTVDTEENDLSFNHTTWVFSQGFVRTADEIQSLMVGHNLEFDAEYVFVQSFNCKVNCEKLFASSLL